MIAAINCAVAANSDRYNNDYSTQSVNSFGGNSVVYSGSGSNLISQNGGSNVIVSRRMGSNQESDDYVSISNPKIRIDGDYCGLICIKLPNIYPISFFSFM